MNRDERLAEPHLLLCFKRAKTRFEGTALGKRYEIQIIGIMRTEDEQKALWAKGRDGDPGRIVTYCDGVIDKSKHQENQDGYSMAIDFAPVKKSTGKIDWLKIVPFYVFGIMCEKEGLTWGGRWRFRDYGHVQL